MDITVPKTNATENEEINLADCESIRNFADRMYKKLNRLDILINNAG